MAKFSLFPAFVRLFYQSTFGTHVMTRPTRAWSGVPWEGPGEYTAWNEAVINADDMVEALVTAMLPLFTPAVEFTSYIIYTVASADADGVPVYAANLTGQVGTNVSTAQIAAFTKSYTFLSASNHPARLTLLDVPTGGEISHDLATSGAAEAALVTEIMSPTNAWAARDGTRLVAFRAVNNSLNQALEKRYRI